MTAEAPPKREGIVWIDEAFDRNDPNVFTARFSAVWEDEEGVSCEERRELAADEAIAWGRARAPVVLLRLGNRAVYYSAGERNPDVETFPPLPDGGLRVERRRSASPLRGGKYAGLRRARREGRERSEARTAARGEEPLYWWEGVGVLLIAGSGSCRGSAASGCGRSPSRRP